MEHGQRQKPKFSKIEILDAKFETYKLLLLLKYVGQGKVHIKVLKDKKKIMFLFLFNNFHRGLYYLIS